MTAAQSVQRAQGLLREFNAAGVLAAGDVHVALRMGRLAGENDETVLFAAALAVRAVRSGSVCLDLGRMRELAVDAESGVEPERLPWPAPDAVSARLRRSPLVVGSPAGPLRPLRLVDTGDGQLLYLDRYYRQEQTIRRILDERAASTPAIDVASTAATLHRLFPGPAPDRQRLAAALAATGWTTLVAGGPGTGKTHTVARILALLTDADPDLRIGLAAPTGKAAVRLQEQVRAQAAELGLRPDLTAATLHRLLGWQRTRAVFRFGAASRLPYDVVVVDETSMVSLTLMCRLLEAMRPDARLILVGDPDQLASVEAGAVLADLVARPVAAAADPRLPELAGADLAGGAVAMEPVLGGGVAGDPVPGGVVTGDAVAGDPVAAEPVLDPGERARLGGGIIRLYRGHRFSGTIAELATAIRDGDPVRTLELLRSGDPAVSFQQPGDWSALRADVVDCAARVTACAARADAAGALRELGVHRLLCAHRDGPFGVERWRQEASAWVAAAAGERFDPRGWYPGQPLLVTANDYDARIYNGDTGVVVRRDGELLAAFERGDEPFLLYPSRLPSVQTVYAMTIHRSQGSQYAGITVLLPGEGSSLLTRELFYTAITRARERVRVVGTENSVHKSVCRRVDRASGLRWSN